MNFEIHEMRTGAMLEKETEFFDAHRMEWVKTAEGKHALIKDDRLIGFFDSDEAAYKEGARLFGIEPFLIKDVLPQDPILNIPALTYGLINVSL
jgi:hypothetical protein